ncbi:MAG: ribbon-helix-helix protein, CopG family [Acidobacteria bacterium]|nr:ribbon-helix-helix protein, CopG family [Acidobacteriota bacterium]
MTKTTVYLDPDIALALRQLAAVKGRTQAELIREAIASYTQKGVRPKPRGIGRYRSGRKDVSQRAEELLRGAVRNRRWP